MGMYFALSLNAGFIWLTIMGPQVRLCYFIYLLGFFFNVMHILHSYNGTLVNLMDDAQRRFLSLNDTVASGHVWRSGSVAIR